MKRPPSSAPAGALMAAVVAALCLLPPGARASEARSGEQVYAAVCAACHATGVDRAPVFGDRKAWKPLIAEGQRMLVRTATKGIRRMPPRGGDPTLTDLEVLIIRADRLRLGFTCRDGRHQPRV